MTAITRAPQNTNYLQASKFILVFDRTPTTQYFCQSANIPGLSIGQAIVNTPLMDYWAAGNKITYNQFNISFTVDETLTGWRNIHDWFRAIASPKSLEERSVHQQLQNNYKSQRLQSYSDATLTVLSALNNPVVRLRLINTFPISLSDIDFDTKLSADDVITAEASFMFEYHEFENA